MDFWAIFGRTADGLTIVAAVIAFLGVASSWLSRPRLTISAHAISPDSAVINILHSAGSSPARNIFVGWGMLDFGGRAVSGDGPNPWVSVLMPGEYRMVSIYDPTHFSFGGDPDDHEMRQGIPREFGFIADLSWQRPMLPWLRIRRVVVWTVEARAVGSSPIVLAGRTAKKWYASATTSTR